MRAPSLLLFCAGATLLGIATVLLYKGSLAQLTEAIYKIDVTHRPYMVSIERQGLHHCAGAVINRRFVLTSAHCFRSVTNYSVRAGSDMAQQGGSQYAIAEIIIHPKYSAFEVEFDIALVKVRPEFILSRNVYPVRLAEFGDPEPADYDAELCGWGHTKNPTEESKALRRVAVHILPRSMCASLDPEHRPATPLTMCAHFRGNKDKDPYVGEAGAPLMVRGAAVGVASWQLLVAPGAPGAAPGPYALFAGVQALRPWIDTHSRIPPDFWTGTATTAPSMPPANRTLKAWARQRVNDVLLK